MDRNCVLKEYTEEFRQKRINDIADRLAAQSEKMGTSLAVKLDELIEDQYDLRKTEDQDKIQFLFIFRLLTSNYTESYELALGFCNSLMYLDDNLSFVYWYPNSVFENVNADLQQLQKFVKNKFIRMEKHELFYLKQLLLNDSWLAFQKVIKQVMSELVNNINFDPRIFNERINIVCGDYMGAAESFCYIDRNKKTVEIMKW